MHTNVSRSQWFLASQEHFQLEKLLSSRFEALNKGTIGAPVFPTTES